MNARINVISASLGLLIGIALGVAAGSHLEPASRPEIPAIKAEAPMSSRPEDLDLEALAGELRQLRTAIEGMASRPDGASGGDRSRTPVLPATADVDDVAALIESRFAEVLETMHELCGLRETLTEATVAAALKQTDWGEVQRISSAYFANKEAGIALVLYKSREEILNTIGPPDEVAEDRWVYSNPVRAPGSVNRFTLFFDGGRVYTVAVSKRSVR